MNIIATEFEGLFLIEPAVLKDNRGFFFESYSFKKLQEAGLDYTFVQDNQSKSTYGVLRGLHFQNPPYAQTKLVRAIKGTILDVVVDIRKSSPTYGKHFAIELSEENKKQLLIPHGFAHGFSVLTAEAEILYKCDNYYHKESEGGLLFNDSSLEIDWKVKESEILLSDKDKLYPKLTEFTTQFD